MAAGLDPRDIPDVPVSLPSVVRALRDELRIAVALERERCAKIAEMHENPETGGLACGCGEEIAEMIRKGLNAHL